MMVVCSAYVRAAYDVSTKLNSDFYQISKSTAVYSVAQYCKTIVANIKALIESYE